MEVSGWINVKMTAKEAYIFKFVFFEFPEISLFCDLCDCCAARVQKSLFCKYFYYCYYYYLFKLQMGFYPVAVVLQ
jgi:hypothetical protein